MPGPRRACPYYKVQVFDERSVTWREKKVGFDTIEEANEYVNSMPTEQRMRIVLVDEDGYHNVDPEA